jgi:hypothetical protein
VIRTPLLAHIDNLTKNTSVTVDALWTYFRIALFSLVALVSVVLIEFTYFNSTMSYPPEWSTRYETQCGTVPEDFNYYTLKATALPFIAYGAYFGILFKSYYNLNNASLLDYAPVAIFENEKQGTWTMATFSGVFYRIIFGTVCSGLCYLPVKAVQTLFASQLLNQYLLSYLLAYMMLGVALYGVTDIALQGWNYILSNSSGLQSMNPSNKDSKKDVMMELSDYKVVILQ